MQCGFSQGCSSGDVQKIFLSAVAFVRRSHLSNSFGFYDMAAGFRSAVVSSA